MGDLDREKNRVPESRQPDHSGRDRKGAVRISRSPLAPVATGGNGGRLPRHYCSTEDASIGTVVDNKYVTEYPLLLRSWDDLVNLVAGVQGQRYTESGRQHQRRPHRRISTCMAIRQLENNFLLDGMDNNSISENVQELTTQVARPSVDALQEFKIITNPYSAEYSRGGAVDQCDQPRAARTNTTARFTSIFSIATRRERFLFQPAGPRKA